MNLSRRNFLAASLAVSATGLCAAAADASETHPEQSAGSMVEKVKNAMLAMQRYSWEQGMAGQAMWEWGDRETAVLLARASLINTTEDGRLAAVGDGATDPAMAGEMVWRAGLMSADEDLLRAADNLLEFLLKRAPRADDGTLYHVFGSPEAWADGFSTASMAAWRFNAPTDCSTTWSITRILSWRPI
jgi:hypothetical protein